MVLLETNSTPIVEAPRQNPCTQNIPLRQHLGIVTPFITVSDTYHSAHILPQLRLASSNKRRITSVAAVVSITILLVSGLIFLTSNFYRIDYSLITQFQSTGSPLLEPNRHTPNDCNSSSFWCSRIIVERYSTNQDQPSKTRFFIWICA